ncbi:MAG: hypothetical protein JWP94_1684 [Mucilaginibacter sp.]|jgi:hypothetical protein|nr:hypothetical protein [Mucilaginibacter sp.]
MLRSRFILSLIVFTVTCSLFSCRNNSSVKAFKRDGLAIEIARIAGEPGAASGLNYSARLIPDKKLADTKDKELTSALWYRMDSCFYLQQGGKKVFASIIQPIANGVAGSYEYFLSFDISQAEESKWHLIYQDKYLNQKKYSLNLGDQ